MARHQATRQEQQRQQTVSQEKESGRADVGTKWESMDDLPSRILRLDHRVAGRAIRNLADNLSELARP